MKKILLGMLTMSAIFLVACGGGSSTEKVESSVSSKEVVEESSQEEVAEGKKTEYNQDIIDDENVKISLMSIEHVIDKDFDEEKYVISFDVTNKREHTVTVQAREVSIDNRMVDEGLLNMSTDVAAGKSATAKLEVQDYNKEELPKLTGNLELILHTFDWDAMDYEHDVPVSIAIK